MSAVPDLGVLREVVRQGEAILGVQKEAKEAIERRGADLLRLSVATLGGVIIVGGILSAAHVAVDALGFGGLVAAVSLLVAAAGIFSLMLAGVPNRRAYASGPNTRILVDQIRREDPSLERLLMSIVKSQPVWVEDNARMADRMQRAIAFGLGTLATGVFVLLGTLLYILGGVILG